jgi:hypothetical protein
MEPDPDVKDWTWTLQRRCPDCGLSAGEVEPSEVPNRVAMAAGEWVQILTSNPGVGVRPSATVWSPLEYGAHVRDVLWLFDARVAMMLVEDEPTFPNWDQDETAIAERYAEQDPDVVADELAGAAAALTRRLAGLEPSQLDRRGRRSDGADFTVATLSQYGLHDVAHHLWDVTGQQDGVASLELA